MASKRIDLNMDLVFNCAPIGATDSLFSPRDLILQFGLDLVFDDCFKHYISMTSPHARD